MKCSNCGHEQALVFIANAGAPAAPINAIGAVAIPAAAPMQFTYNAAAAAACAPQFIGTYFVIPCN